MDGGAGVGPESVDELDEEMGASRDRRGAPSAAELVRPFSPGGGSGFRILLDKELVDARQTRQWSG